MEIEYTLDGQTGTRFMLTVRSKENIYRKIVDEDDFSSIHVPLEDLAKLLSREPLGISGLSTSVNFMELFQEQMLNVDIELCFQKSERMKRMTESYTISLPKIDRDMQLEEITKLKNENSALRRENERIIKKLRAMETFGFFPYYNKDIVKIDSKIKIYFNAFYLPAGSHIRVEVKNEDQDFFHFLFNHPRFSKYVSWIKIYREKSKSLREEYVPDGYTYVEFFPFMKEKIEWGQLGHEFYPMNSMNSNKIQFKKSFPNFKWNMNLQNGLNQSMTMPNHQENIDIICFLFTLFDLVNEYNFRGIQLLPGGQCVPHENPDHVNEFFTEKYIRNPPTPADKLFLDPHIGFYKCSLYDF